MKKPGCLKLICILAIIGLMGCSIICKFGPTQQAQTSQTLQALQTSYTTVVAILEVTPNPQVQIAVALTDAALHLVGAVLASYCPSQTAIALAETTAKQALAAQKAVLGSISVSVK